MDASELKLECLRLAVEAREVRNSQEILIKKAQTFYDFVKRETKPRAPSKSRSKKKYRTSDNA